MTINLTKRFIWDNPRHSLGISLTWIQYFCVFEMRNTLRESGLVYSEYNWQTLSFRFHFLDKQARGL